MNLHHGDCLEVLRTILDCSVDSVVTDPPYGLSFMGNRWDHGVPSVDIWCECLRVLKPGGHLLAFAGTRTQHRMCVNIEDAGFEIRDMIAWVYGSGFPKSMDISKAIDKAAGAQGGRGPLKRGGERLARLADGKRDGEGRWGDESGRDPYTYLAATPEAQRWEGWGTALKPALEPITVARKPFKGTVAQNVLEHGTGGINIDACRVGTDQIKVNGWKCGGEQVYNGRQSEGFDGGTHQGRWPANLIHDGSEEVTQLFGGSAARFFYCAKTSKADREDGNVHPTVKPTDLMAYLCRLVTPPGGIVLDPFMGSGSTIKAALSEGFRAIGIERDPSYYAIAERRLNDAQLGLPMELEP